MAAGCKTRRRACLQICTGNSQKSNWTVTLHRAEAQIFTWGRIPKKENSSSFCQARVHRSEIISTLYSNGCSSSFDQVDSNARSVVPLVVKSLSLFGRFCESPVFQKAIRKPLMAFHFLHALRNNPRFESQTRVPYFILTESLHGTCFFEEMYAILPESLIYSNAGVILIA